MSSDAPTQPVISLPPPAPGAAPVPPAPPRLRHRRRAVLFVALVATVAWVAGLTGALLGDQLSNWLDKPPNRASDEPLTVAEQRDTIQTRVDVGAVVDYVAPSVVTISADVNGGTSLGTGLILTSDGEILTNAHVVEGASEIRVRLAGETEPRRVSLLAADRGNDLALLRISGDGFQAATFADPGSVRLGDEVVLSPVCVDTAKGSIAHMKPPAASVAALGAEAALRRRRGAVSAHQ